jgi:cytochrome c5
MKTTLFAVTLSLACATTFATTGEDTYKAVCANCHATGLAGSPKVGNTNEWGKLIKEGQINLTADGYNGVRGMPARGGRAELTVADFGSAVAYMANQAGANWQEPDASMLKKINARLDKRNAAKK